MKKSLLFLLLPVLMMACNNTTDKNEKALQRQVDALYQRLSLEEKAAQLFGIYPGELMVDGEVSRENAVR